MTPTSPKLRHVLAALILHANRPLRPESLIDELWSGEPPVSAATTLQTYIYRLRKKLCPYRRVGERELLLTVNSSYLLRTQAEQLDLTLFEQLFRMGQEALGGGRPDRASTLLGEALSLWRGNMLEDISVGPLLEASLVHFEEARLRAFEMRMEAGLQLGRHQELIPDLKALTTSHPLHEGFPAQLMLALYRSDRRLEALEVYHSLRRRLVDELGVDPSSELEHLNRAILRADPGLDLPGEKRTGVQLTYPPRALPADKQQVIIHQFSAAQLEALLSTAFMDVPRADSRPQLVALHGMPGVGKSALALHVAQRLRPRFAGGQLYLDLRDGQGRPLTCAEAMARMLRQAGIEFSPSEGPAEGRRRFRSWSADRRLLVILDNVTSADQVLPLLPSGPECATILTSRSHLVGLGDVVAFDLAPLSVNEGVQLLASLILPEHVVNDREHAEQVVRMCGCLPAAISAAAHQFRQQPRWRLRDLAAWLADPQSRLKALGSPEGDLCRTFELSGAELGRSGLQLLEADRGPAFGSEPPVQDGHAAHCPAAQTQGVAQLVKERR
ncbi:BTAD domain-containing putative transcriptional regulator [Streptomyces sp. NPDC028722]|uniref:AfsR/SARP family transcriptional regulator n=1 Tax=unclassified Streptomyces TaxID=2593676 RepID=UPI0033D3C4B8